MVIFFLNKNIYNKNFLLKITVKKFPVLIPNPDTKVEIFPDPISTHNKCILSTSNNNTLKMDNF